MGGNGGFALDLELWLNPANACMEYCGALSPTSPYDYTPSGVTLNYALSDCVFNLALLKLDNSLTSRFNDIATKGDTLYLPYTTFHCHNSSVSAQQQTVFVSDATTDLRRLYVVMTDSGRNASSQVMKFYGSKPDAMTLQTVTGGVTDVSVDAYNFIIGNKHIFNSPVIDGQFDNTLSLENLRNAHYLGSTDKSATGSQYWYTNYESRKAFVLAGNFTYSDESNHGMVQGVNLAGLPAQCDLSFNAAPVNKVIHSFAEVGYYLVIKDGDVNYVEVKKDMNDYSY